MENTYGAHAVEKPALINVMILAILYAIAYSPKSFKLQYARKKYLSRYCIEKYAKAEGTKGRPNNINFPERDKTGLLINEKLIISKEMKNSESVVIFAQ